MGYIKYLGHAAFEILLDGKKILIDPWLTNPLSPVKPSDISSVDYIVVTHDHGDHLGEAIELLKRMTNAKLIAIYEIAEYAKTQGVSEAQAIGCNIGGSIRIPGEDKLSFALTPANHSSSRGAPTGVVIKGSEATIYHAGDTGIISEMQLIGDIYKPDYALLPIGGHFTMDIHEALKAVELIRPKYVIPMHYNTFPLITADPHKFKELVEAKTATKVIVLKPGEKHGF